MRSVMELTKDNHVGVVGNHPRNYWKKCGKKVSPRRVDCYVLKWYRWPGRQVRVLKSKNRAQKLCEVTVERNDSFKNVMVSINVEKNLDLQMLKRKFQKKGCSYTKMNLYDGVMTCDAQGRKTQHGSLEYKASHNGGFPSGPYGNCRSGNLYEGFTRDNSPWKWLGG